MNALSFFNSVGMSHFDFSSILINGCFTSILSSILVNLSGNELELSPSSQLTSIFSSINLEQKCIFFSYNVHDIVDLPLGFHEFSLIQYDSSISAHE